jgi:hypothetical protein
MSILFDLAMTAVKATAAARSASRLARHESAALEELHQGFAPARQHVRAEQAQDLGAQAGAAETSESGADGDDGLLDTVLGWVEDLW